MKRKNDSELVSNRRAYHDYHILETFEAGIALQGTEVKSLKEHAGNLQDSYVTIEKNEVWLKSASIAPYKFGTAFNHEEKRDRKLLLHHYEIEKLKKLTEQKGMTIVPLSIYLKKGLIKVKIAAAKGKKTYDKRESIKEREQKRSIERALKQEK